MEAQKSPVIELPKDPKRVVQLRMKLQEYRNRIDPRRPIKFQPVRYKIEVLSRLLEGGRVETWELSRELAKKDGVFNDALFQNACGVIDDYCTTGGENCGGGTGLPPL